MPTKKEELTKKISDYTKAIAGGFITGAILDAIKKKKADAEKELSEIKEEGSEKKEEKPDKGGKKAKAKGKAAAKPKPEKKVKEKKAPKKAKEKPAKSPHLVNKSNRTVTIAGIEYSVDNCNEALEAWDAEIERKRESGKKFAKRSSGEVIGDKLSSAGAKVLSSIKKTDTEKKPTYYKDKLERLSKVMTELASLIDDLVGKDDASDEVKGLVKQIQEYIKKNLSK